MFTKYPQTKTIDGIGAVTFKKSPRAKHLKLSVKPSREIFVTVPRFCTLSAAEYFVGQRKMWIQKTIKKFDQKKAVLKPKNKQDIECLREKTRKIITPKVEFYALRNGFDYEAIRIKNMTSRWGSCSSKKNLNFSMYLGLLPEKYVDYVVAHELCHTVEMNHSRSFWDLLESVYPGARAVDREMRQFQLI